MSKINPKTDKRGPTKGPFKGLCAKVMVKVTVNVTAGAYPEATILSSGFVVGASSSLKGPFVGPLLSVFLVFFVLFRGFSESTG